MADECLPIKLLKDLEVWELLKEEAKRKHKVYPLQTRTSIRYCPKTLICHDMQGGYLDDRFVHGTKRSNYYFTHWTMVDIFVYFSHHLVTIPPCGWITAAHRNGVKILGTFITESVAGAKTCDSIFSDVPTVQKYCMQLVKIAEYFQFDGWLINIENKINVKQVPLLQEFVRFLTLKMHEFQKDSLVIWYDSVIESGELKWQNELNESNRNFFDVSDGIFLNYNWTKDTLKASLNLAAGRESDIYVGVDVFGRGCLGGGGFSSNIAVMVARDFNLSVAIFAPGWVYETLDKNNFEENQSKFWNCLVELCSSRRVNNLPYYSSFCPGFGKNLFRNGEPVTSEPWFNLSLQQPQPSFENFLTSGATLTTSSEDGFNGGGCLRIIIPTLQVDKPVNVPLLSTDFCINKACNVSYTFKNSSNSIEVALIFSVQDGRQVYDYKFTNEFDSEGAEVFRSLCSSFSNSRSFCMLPTSSKKIVAWTKRKYSIYSVGTENCFVKEVQLQIKCKEEEENICILLGEFEISSCHESTLLECKDLNAIQFNPGTTSLKLLLQWTSQAKIDASDLYICVNGRKHYICTTSQSFYAFSDFLHRSFLEDFIIVFILYPKRFGKTLQPAILKINLE